MTKLPEDTVHLLHEHGQDAILELELATLDLTANEKWAVEQLLIAYVADSVPPEVWTQGIDAGVRAVSRGRALNSARSIGLD